jgi:ATP-dependent RNA helicase RhlE
VYLVESQHKRPLLLSLVGQDEGNILVFARTKHRTDRLVHSVRQAGHAVQRIHSDRSQSQRREALEGFRNGRYRILVATDIAARGIDIDHVGHVINYDVPHSAEDYVHRIGRTARAGRKGMAIMLATSRDRSVIQAIERLMGRSINSKPETTQRRPQPTEERELATVGADSDGSRTRRRNRRGGRSRQRTGAPETAPLNGSSRPPRQRTRGESRRERVQVEPRTPNSGGHHPSEPQPVGLFQSVLGRIFRR